ncbi:hypothetical protein RND81_04G121800 [Saponaria officinalis]|uniref:Uncharacterized protein n=1 Tax=Saponaria officinalis TaxID=3572 RepID=A0AAW1LE25_SAPOF
MLLSSSFSNNNNLIKLEKSIPSISFSELTLNSSPIAMDEEEPRRVARSVAAGCLLEHFDDTKPNFFPIVSEIMVAHLNRYHLISAFERECLMKVSEDNCDDPIEKMISAIEIALVSIEKDTGGVTCYLAHNLDGKGKDRVYVMSIRVHTLVTELLPVSLRLHHLSVCPAQISEREDYQRKKAERLKLLESDDNWIECPVKTTKLRLAFLRNKALNKPYSLSDSLAV